MVDLLGEKRFRHAATASVTSRHEARQGINQEISVQHSTEHLIF
jgi:hypothetical protein